MTDAETLRAAAEVLQRRGGWTVTRITLDTIAGELEAEDAAKLKTAERDQRLAEVAWEAWVNAQPCNPYQAVCLSARAVREAIEAES